MKNNPDTIMHETWEMYAQRRVEFYALASILILYIYDQTDWRWLLVPFLFYSIMGAVWFILWTVTNFLFAVVTVLEWFE